MIFKKKRRLVSLWIEWNEEEKSRVISDLIVRNGALGVEIDADVDIENYPLSEINREHTVLRVCIDRKYPVFQLLSDIASHPSVFSVGEM